MNAGPPEIGRRVRFFGSLLGLLVCVSALTACEHLTPDPPPPVAEFEVPPAPPGARGAHAAGIEPPLRLPTGPGPWPDSPSEPGAPEEESEAEPGTPHADPGGVTL
jgi:hypothetical protein